ncbi:hypothetical protein SUGI_0553590 [Cryptomeria japonica]|nr:hypothetical protein SUGI_0553590 [Cryptomeria japonica]
MMKTMDVPIERKLSLMEEMLVDSINKYEDRSSDRNHCYAEVNRNYVKSINSVRAGSNRESDLETVCNGNTPNKSGLKTTNEGSSTESPYKKNEDSSERSGESDGSGAGDLSTVFDTRCPWVPKAGPCASTFPEVMEELIGQRPSGPHAGTLPRQRGKILQTKAGLTSEHVRERSTARAISRRKMHEV